ncbi:hypothetical protein NX059_006746 [Plenodomus lindquistii]|nr:hypothetical protein NX059_006746 [Plenodomus lindquistii]
MSDLEGDSTMHSSPSNDDDEMFPDEAISNNTTTAAAAVPTPSTPHHPALASTSLSELSPPNSQSQSRDPSTLTKGVNGNGKRPPSAAENAMLATGSGGTHHDPETGYSWSRTEDQPGFEWRSNRAREDEMRALDVILDLGRQIKTKYGDPLDATVTAKAKR